MFTQEVEDGVASWVFGPEWVGVGFVDEAAVSLSDFAPSGGIEEEGSAGMLVGERGGELGGEAGEAGGDLCNLIWFQK